MGVGFFELAISQADTELLLRHYAVAGPFIDKILGGIPFVWTTLPTGVNGPIIYHGPLSDKTRTDAPVIDVPMKSGMRRYPKLSADRISGLVRHGAVELYSWSPTIEDPTRVRFARLLVERHPDTPRGVLVDALGVMSQLLVDEEDLGCVLVLDGRTGAALWIPFADAPTYDAVRLWSRGCCERAVERHADLVTLAPNTHADSLAHLHVQSNAVGRFSAVPYSVRAAKGFPIAIPVSWEDVLKSGYTEAVCAGELDSWLASQSCEWFSADANKYSKQRFGDRDKAASQTFVVAVDGVPVLGAQKTHGPVISAAIAVLQDGHSHSAEEILTLALQLGLLDASTTHKYVYTSLIEYIARANGNGRKPTIVQNADRTFRINEPRDDWPSVVDTVAPVVSPAVAACIDQLEATSASAESDAFEQAVCDAFDLLGFVAVHLGGQKAPDGYADAMLGPLGYRVMIECKSSDEGVNDPNVFEAAKFKDSYGAQYCALVGRAFSGEIEVAKELQNHGVSAWSVEDLQTVLRISANPLEMRALFVPGFAADALDDLVWERAHGRAKRVRIIADTIVRTGWATQSAYRSVPAEAPRLTEDVAMVLVNQDLATQESSATCSRDDVRAAIEYLSNPLIRAVELDADGSIVVLIDALG